MWFVPSSNKCQWLVILYYIHPLFNSFGTNSIPIDSKSCCSFALPSFSKDISVGWIAHLIFSRPLTRTNKAKQHPTKFWLINLQDIFIHFIILTNFNVLKIHENSKTKYRNKFKLNETLLQKKSNKKTLPDFAQIWTLSKRVLAILVEVVWTKGFYPHSCHSIC